MRRVAYKATLCYVSYRCIIMANPINKDYPYLELDIIDYIYNYTEYQSITTDELLDYIKYEFGDTEYNSLMEESNRRFKYKYNKNKNNEHIFSGYMPIEYTRDILLSCFFLSSYNIDMRDFKYTSLSTLNKRSAKENFIFLSDVDDSEKKDYAEITNFECIVASNGIRLFGGFVFDIYLPNKISNKKRKYVASRVYDTCVHMNMREGNTGDGIDYHGINIKYTGISGLREGL